MIDMKILSGQRLRWPECLSVKMSQRSRWKDVTADHTFPWALERGVKAQVAIPEAITMAKSFQ